jgi:uncharacterized protein YndB with AHSA1/START domain
MSDTSDTSDTPDTSEAPPARVVRRSTVVATPPEEVFDLLADPSRHAEIDGSGTVEGSRVEGPERLGPGARFGMRMKLGVPYRVTNEVVEFDEPRVISWRHFGGHVWRYRLEPVDGGTVVTEEFDYRGAKAPFLLEWTRAPSRNAAAIEATLERLGEVFGRPEPDTGG